MGALPPIPLQGHHALDLIFSHKRCLCEGIKVLESWDIDMHRRPVLAVLHPCPDTAETFYVSANGGTGESFPCQGTGQSPVKKVLRFLNGKFFIVWAVFFLHILFPKGDVLYERKRTLAEIFADRTGGGLSALPQTGGKGIAKSAPPYRGSIKA